MNQVLQSEVFILHLILLLEPEVIILQVFDKQTLKFSMPLMNFTELQVSVYAEIKKKFR